MLLASERADPDSIERHARTHLPKYAVPLFLRHMAAPATTHNNKQDKAPLKLQGVDPSKVAPQDTLYWIDRHGKGDTYVPFTKEGWEDMEAGRARL